MESYQLIYSDGNEICKLAEDVLGTNQLVIKEKIELPEAKPDLEQIEQVITEVIIENVKIVFIKDMRCKQLSIKLIICGLIKEKIIYTADLPDQPMHSAHFTRPFYGFVLLDFDLNLKNKHICYDNKARLLEKFLDVDVCVENVSIRKVTSRKFIKYITLLISVRGCLDEIIDYLVIKD